jgi:hypothetical protein
MTCLRMPQSLPDAEAIIEACTSPGWRGDFVTGLVTVAILAVVFLAMSRLAR